ncbi:S-layer family protein [Variovorax sp. J22R133]|uniref:beta strand repeat-containing protein n=1 Tax=Variovorax brevis TaxID=3053503 RepID=UPI002574FFAF|nr:S-layer family protein [Variovorax sp. J22R133]MDM0117590.1 S-layer family protein [Variovorax sp. J22R133]
MKKTNNKPAPRKGPQTMRNGVSVAVTVLGTLMAANAHASPMPPSSIATTQSSIDSDGNVMSVTTTGYQSVQNSQISSEDHAATASGSNVGLSVNGPQTGSTHSVTSNSLSSVATGNTGTNSIDLGLTGAMPVDGEALLNLQNNVGVVFSTASTNSVGLMLNGFSSGGAGTTNNTISADATFNSASSTIAGIVPNGYISATPASAALSYGGATLTSLEQGSIVATSQQGAAGASSNATARDNTIGLTLSSDGANTVSAAPVLSGNAITATLQGNSAVNGVGIQSGGAPAFAGSAVVTNLQVVQGQGPTTHTATNSGSTIEATIGTDSAGNANTLQGALAVQNNSITSAITGNQALGALGAAGNSIQLGDGMSFAGPASASVNGSTSTVNGANAAAVNADLAILNTQANVDVSLTSSVSGGSIAAVAQSPAGAAVTVSGNSMTAAASGNAASGAIASGKDAATFSGTAALNSQQANYGSGVTATNSHDVIGAFTGNGVDNPGTTSASTITTANNLLGATAYGNESGQSLSLAAATLGMGSGNAVLTNGDQPSGSVSAVGGATIANLQSSYASPVTATMDPLADGGIGVSASASVAIAGSTISVAGNTQQAIGVSNSGVNALSLSGTSVGAGAGIASVQNVDAASTVAAALNNPSSGAVIDSPIQGSTLSLTGDLHRAIGYGNSASSTLNVSANSLDMTGASSGVASVVDSNTLGGTVSAAYGVLSSQSAMAAVGATVSVDPTLPQASVGQFMQFGADVTGSTVGIQQNTIVAAAYGNAAASGIALGLGAGVSSEGYAPVANVTNAQQVDADITAAASGGRLVLAAIDGAVTASSVANSRNEIQALAIGNQASGNTLSVTGNAINVASAVPRGGAGGAFLGTSITDAAFSVQNVQTGAGTVTATQLTSGGIPAAASIATQVSGVVANSGLEANGNSSVASATSNSATNALSMSANLVATSSALQNTQMTTAAVTALIGLPAVPGSPGTLPVPFWINATASDLIGTSVGLWETVTGGTLSVPTSSLTPAEITYLENNGWSLIGNNLTTAAAPVLGTIPFAVYVDFAEGRPVPFPATIPGAPATARVPDQGGVTLAVGGAVTGSTLSVNGNTASASVTGNSASNSVSIAGTSIAAGSGQTVASVSAGGLGLGGGAQADHTLVNSQGVNDAVPLSSSVYGRYAIDARPGSAITGSSLSVSNNAQRGMAVANTAANSLAVSGGNVQTTSALVSQQWSGAQVSAASDMELYAPGAVSGSSVALSGNANTALGVANDASNALSVSGTNVTPVGPVTNAQLLTIAGSVGDHVLNNTQGAFSSVNSTATTKLYNEDGAAAATAGLNHSSLTISGNSTVAEASLNRADNAVALNATAAEGANAGLANAQFSIGAATASATTAATFALNGTGAPPVAYPALNQGSATIDGNSTTALARGNVASNLLAVSAGRGYGVSSASTAGSSQPGDTQATAAIQNWQSNLGDVSATSTASYSVALNGTGGAAASTGGSIGVTSNTVAASAYGNSVTNGVTVAAPNTGSPTAAVSNYQVNAGNVTATATSVSYGIGVTSAVTRSALRVTGNQVSATAVGNSAVNTIAAR